MALPCDVCVDTSLDPTSFDRSQPAAFDRSQPAASPTSDVSCKCWAWHVCGGPPPSPCSENFEPRDPSLNRVNAPNHFCDAHYNIMEVASARIRVLRWETITEHKLSNKGINGGFWAKVDGHKPCLPGVHFRLINNVTKVTKGLPLILFKDEPGELPGTFMEVPSDLKNAQGFVELTVAAGVGTLRLRAGHIDFTSCGKGLCICSRSQTAGPARANTSPSDCHKIIKKEKKPKKQQISSPITKPKSVDKQIKAFLKKCSTDEQEKLSALFDMVEKEANVHKNLVNAMVHVHNNLRVEDPQLPSNEPHQFHGGVQDDYMDKNVRWWPSSEPSSADTFSLFDWNEFC